VDEREMRTRFAAARVARLATIGRDGLPHLVPVCFAVVGGVVVSAVDAKPKTTAELRRLDNIAANAAVSVLADEYFDDWTRLWWVRADGDGRVIRSGAEHRDAVEHLVAKYPQYRANPPTGAVIEVVVRSWRGWAWSG
jgi:PPOX class probable F420-dependent enzyme